MWLITGSSGQLGSCMTDLLTRNSIEYVAVTHKDMDIADQEGVDHIFNTVKPDFVLNAAAWTAVEDAERYESSAFAVNAIGAANVARASLNNGARMIHVSTDYVFSGHSSSPYMIDHPTDPVNAYGRTKLAGETAVREIGKGEFPVVRTAWLYSQYGENFAKTMVSRALRGESVGVVSDQIGQPTSAEELAKFILEVSALNTVPAIVHGTNMGQASWFEFANEIYSLLSAETSLVKAVDTAAFPTVAKRPAYSVLDHSHNNTFGLTSMKDWKIALASVISGLRLRVEEETKP